MQFDINLDILTLDGDLVLALEDEVNGFWVRRGGMPTGERRWNRNEVTSPWVDGAGLVGATLDQNTESLLVKVFGPTWVNVETRYQALLDATTAHAWLLRESIEGVSRVWRAGPVDVLPAPVEPVDIANKRRFVVLTFPTQPTPTVSGI